MRAHGWISANLGATVKVLAWTIADYGYKVIDWEKVVAQAKNRLPIVNILSPAEYEVIECSSVTFKWIGSDSDGTVVGYYFSFDDPILDTWTTETSYEAASLSSGTHTFYVQAEDDEGSKSEVESRTFTVKIEPSNTPPIAIPHVSPNVACEGEEFCFYDTSYDPDGDIIVAWYWDFNDSNTADQQNSNHTYFSAGTYYPTLKVKDSQGAWSKSVECEVTVLETSPKTATISVQTTPVAGDIYINADWIGKGSASGEYEVSKSYTISFSDVQGYQKPASETITLSSRGYSKTYTYIQESNSATLTVTPSYKEMLQGQGAWLDLVFKNGSKADTYTLCIEGKYGWEYNVAPDFVTKSMAPEEEFCFQFYIGVPETASKGIYTWKWKVKSSTGDYVASTEATIDVKEGTPPVKIVEVYTTKGDPWPDKTPKSVFEPGDNIGIYIKTNNSGYTIDVIYETRDPSGNRVEYLSGEFSDKWPSYWINSSLPGWASKGAYTVTVTVGNSSESCIFNVN
jgi:PKD repeat protein